MEERGMKERKEEIDRNLQETYEFVLKKRKREGDKERKKERERVGGGERLKI